MTLQYVTDESGNCVGISRRLQESRAAARVLSFGGFDNVEFWPGEWTRLKAFGHIDSHIPSWPARIAEVRAETRALARSYPELEFRVSDAIEGARVSYCLEARFERRLGQ